MKATEHELIEHARILVRKLARLLTLKGLPHADATVALAYALHDSASDLTGNPIAGIEWMRDAADLMERKLMEESNGKQSAH